MKLTFLFVITGFLLLGLGVAYYLYNKNNVVTPQLSTEYFIHSNINQQQQIPYSCTHCSDDIELTPSLL
jgi:hypothetical protein